MTKFRFLALFAALALLLTLSTTVLAQQPKLPHTFTGEVMVGTDMAMEGTMVTAMIDGETVGMAEVTMDGMYSIQLNPGDPTAEGYMDFTGKEVMFMVGMATVEEPAMWMEGMISPLNLMVPSTEPEPTAPPVMMPGPEGPRGHRGPEGPPGADGKDGADGQRGPQGPPGADGEDGMDGRDGMDGAKGDDGEIGHTGAQGPAGADGADGAQGPPGMDGAAGAPGARGADGADGGGGVLGILGFILAIVALVAAGGVYAMSRR